MRPINGEDSFMKPNQWIFLAVAVVVVIYAVKVYAGSVQMTTYYPAPTGYYDNMKVNKSLAIPCYQPGSANAPTVSGSIWIEDTDSSCTP